MYDHSHRTPYSPHSKNRSINYTFHFTCPCGAPRAAKGDRGDILWQLAGLVSGLLEEKEIAEAAYYYSLDCKSRLRNTESPQHEFAREAYERVVLRWERQKERVEMWRRRILELVADA